MSYEYSSLLGRFCVPFITGRREDKNSPYGKYTDRTKNVSVFNWKLVHNTHNWNAILPQRFAWQRNKCGRSRTSDRTRTSCLLNILLHCFLNVTALLHFPLGSPPICGSIMLLPLADILTGYCCCLPQASPNGFTALDSLGFKMVSPAPPPENKRWNWEEVEIEWSWITFLKKFIFHNTFWKSEKCNCSCFPYYEQG